MAACNTEDPNLIRYVSDKTTDMHRDQAMRLFKLPEEQITKPIRYAGKNQFVFPEFYGSYFVQCAKPLWRTAHQQKTAEGQLLIEHLKSVGLGSYRRFEMHVEKEERIFWKEKFKVYNRWKERTWKKYQRDGYIDLITGFRCSGLMSKNDVSNYPNQGPAFHCLLWSLIQLSQRSLEEQWESFIVGQIHDDMVWCFEPEELGTIKAPIRKVMTVDIRDHWPWIIVPLDIELEISETNGNWYEQKKEPI
jgi:DNA polymerase I-like protein with 3'-5' exonuclease and polymerase domains